MRVQSARAHPEDDVDQLFVPILGAFQVLGQQRLMLQVDPVRDMLEKDQARRDMPLSRPFHIAARLVRSLEETSFDPEGEAFIR